MQFNLFIVIGIGLAAMFFGYFFGLFEGRGQGYKKRKKEEPEEKKIQPPVIAPPKELNFSTSSVRAPSRAAVSAATIPDDPAPTIAMSHVSVMIVQ